MIPSALMYAVFLSVGVDQTARTIGNGCMIALIRITEIDAILDPKRAIGFGRFHTADV